MRKKKPIILATAIILAVATALAASTFAWFQAQEEVVNRIDTAKFADGDVSIIETFDPDDELKPGVDINKDVGVINTGSAPALARISFKEMLLKLAPKEATAVDMLVRKDTKFVAATAPAIDTEIPSLVNIGAFSTIGWTKWSDTPLLFLDTDSQTNMATLTGLGIEFVYKQTSVDPAPKKYSFAAYASMGTTPPTYQRVELRPELLSMVRNTDASITTPPTGIAGYNSYGLKVTLTDPASVLYPNESNRFWSFTTLKLANGGVPYNVDWRLANSLGAPVGVSPPLRTGYISATSKFPAVTDFDNAKLMLVFHGANVDFGTDPAAAAGKWWYNQTDGYFYFMGLVEPGTASPLLLSAVSLDTSATSEYSHLKFDLTVVMTAIQATEAAVTASDGWNLTGVLASTLQGFCPD